LFFYVCFNGQKAKDVSTTIFGVFFSSSAQRTSTAVEPLLPGSLGPEGACYLEIA